MLLRFLLVLHGLMSLLALVLYGYDKAQAKRKGRRVAEKTLHWIAALGGWPGALLGQQLFRHKRSKASFMSVFRVIVIGHAAFWGVGLLLYWSYAAR